mmetsp:Transcript_47381/g.95642  ORF Transcript_47381/g.95642 Transcript_47381/m.95642 type:complete len:175 (-) Transcript_47381:193-717(-)
MATLEPVVVQRLNGDELTIEVTEGDTVATLQSHAEQALGVVNAVKLVFEGDVLDPQRDAAGLSGCKVDAVVHDQALSAQGILAAFNLVGTNGSGSIDAKEWKDIWTELTGEAPPKDKVCALIIEFDDDGSGTTDYEGFQRFMTMEFSSNPERGPEWEDLRRRLVRRIVEGSKST